ncbi:LysM peptidoglycan-binding domain-containing protein [Roseibacillus ishigakijimensis]|uniref:LysM peptidoglycan-binding domain-containing protein n=1 Tax=Roseibacillus ishigakijimensis TaxID=454146 RepID=A0A934RL91_9BACT|nr:LysM peptidoglycan-binding domain-containing protein [Roseibacillus ishigakijimensis]MBK1832825.1 LysM peptidoglycan-binding domain-containing protein [Roseibacillus ishigakijimensis]
MRPLTLPALATLLLVSCKDDSPQTLSSPTNLPVTYESTPVRWQERDFTPWGSRAELQVLMESNRDEFFFAAVQGRNQEGFNEYRAVRRPFDDPDYDRWAVFWELDNDQLFEAESKLLRLGFEKHYRQAFADKDGITRTQIIYLRPAAHSETPPPAVAQEETPSSPRALSESATPGAKATVAQQTAEREPAPTETAAKSPPQAADESTPALATTPPSPSGPLGQAAAPKPAQEPASETVPNEKRAESPPAPPTEPVPTAQLAEQTPAQPDPASEPKEEPKAEPKEQPAPTPVAPAEPKLEVYIVKKGDTLSKIAREHRCTVTALKKANGLRSDHLAIGQRLKVPR